MTNNEYSDIFIIIAKANGNKLEKSGRRRRTPKKLPKAGFDTMANFLGAM